MNLFTEEQARAILEKVIKLSKADEITAQLGGSMAGNIRYALNNVSTSGLVHTCDLVVTSAFGKVVATTSINAFDNQSREKVVRRSEELAKLAPENPEFMPAIEKQEYKATGTFNEKTAAVTPEYRAQVAADCIAPCKKDKLVA